MRWWLITDDTHDPIGYSTDLFCGFDGQCGGVRRRFNHVFTRDDNGMPRSWTPRLDVGAIAVDARRGAAAILALLACLRADAASAASAVLDGAVRSLAERPVVSLTPTPTPHHAPFCRMPLGHLLAFGRMRVAALSSSWYKR